MNISKNNTDKRCIKTKLAIRNALSTLLVEKDITQVTVKEISDIALISRNTFYAHYESVYDLMDEIEDELLNQMIELLEEVDVESFRFDPYPILNELTKLVYTDFDLYKNMINSPMSTRLLNKMKQLSKIQLVDITIERLHVSEEILGIMVEFYSAGVVSAYKQWFNSDRSLSLEEVSKTISRMISDGLIGMVNGKG